VGVSLECIVVRPNRELAEKIAREKLVGADEITMTELSQAEIEVLKLKMATFHF
jgi:hypothetical protein